MLLSELLQGIEHEGSLPDREIDRITCDSRIVAPGDLFVCVKGARFDGHDHASEALAAGAAAVVTERDLGLPEQIIAPDGRIAYALLCRNFYHNPQRGLRLIAVTGTSGKTTITFLLRDILRAAGKRVGLIGTIQNEIGEMVISSRHTTPDPWQLYSVLSRMKEAGMEYVVMEASSFGLHQHRMEGLHFECAVFTNLSHEHLDYHNTMEEYYQAKKRLFTVCDKAVVNYDDEYGRRLIGELSCPAATLSLSSDEADYTAHTITYSAEGSRFIVVHGSDIGRVAIRMPGAYSVQNAMCALAAACEVGVPFEQAASGLCESHGVLGRMELVECDLPFTVIRDFAHSPEELRNVLVTVRDFCKGRVVALFGCPGERDRTKRPEMARQVAENADQAILTSDNPRGEDPRQIINDALPGFTGSPTPVQVIEDRFDAIRWAIDFCREGDILLLLGKGHEDYQVLSFGSVYFDESFIVQQIVRSRHDQDSI